METKNVIGALVMAVLALGCVPCPTLRATDLQGQSRRIYRPYIEEYSCAPFREMRTTEQMLAYPWESVYISKMPFLFLESTLEVRDWYRRYGLEVVNFKREPEDFIGFELSFLAHLSQLALDAAEQGDMDGVAALVKAQRDFLSEHLLRWGFEWANRAAQHAETDFYRGFVLMARGALAELAVVYDVAPQAPDIAARQ